VLVVVGDTHGTEGHGLSGTALTAVREADLVVHTGDFTRAPVYDALATEATDIAAVQGNNDDARLCDRLPETRVVEGLDRRFVVAHGHGRDDTSLSLLARQEDADAVIVGHSHRPTIAELGDATLVNPGSYADPRWYRPAYATVERAPADDATVRVSLRSPDGEAFETTTL
jgi:putative phosphoesterase